MDAPISDFDWDKGNRAKCEKHGISPAEIEALFAHPVLIIPDEAHSQRETRLRAIGRTARGRSIFLVFTIRERDGRRLIRPITPRYMHGKEVRSYEKENPDL
jgi:uncharacterized protein